jgi:hypothetical protein
MDDYVLLRQSPHRLSKIVVSDDDYIEFKCSSEIYGITTASGSLDHARSVGAIGCGDGDDYVFDRFDWQEVDNGIYYDNWKKLISALELEKDNVIKLLPVNVPDDTIKELRKQLKNTTIPFKWRNNRFIFDHNITDYFIELKSKGKLANIRQDLQYFGTSDKLAAYMVNKIKPDGHNCLEPSAGMGGIAKLMPRGTIAVEIHKPYCDILEKYRHLRVVCGDFMNISFGKRFDYILANPPFNNGRWQEHFTKMMGLLSDSGRIACILPANAEPWVKSKYPEISVESLSGKEFANQGSNQRGTSVPIVLAYK